MWLDSPCLKPASVPSSTLSLARDFYDKFRRSDTTDLAFMPMNEDDFPELSREPLITALQKVEGYFIPLERLKFQSRTIGSGAFGVVKLAELIPQDANLAPSTIVAIKDLQDISRGVNPLRVAYRLAREMTVWSSLRHGNILEFVGYHLSEDFLVAYLVSPYVKNGNVKDYLRKTQTTLEERLEVVRDTALGLEYLHTRAPPVVHGDLKALNVLINEHHKAVLCDFGLTIAIQDGRTGLTTTTGFKGSTRWCSLEVILGEPKSLESDIWSWGCLVMEILTGNYPYHEIQNNDAIAVFMAHYKRTPWLLNDALGIKPEGLLRLVRSCWDFEAKERPDASVCASKISEIILLEQSLGSIMNIFDGFAARWN